MKQLLLLLLSTILTACATTPKPFAMSEDAVLFLNADMKGTLTDAKGRIFTSKKLKKLIEIGAPVPRAIDIEFDPDITMGALLILCAELEPIEGNIKIHAPPEYKGDTQTIECG